MNIPDFSTKNWRSITPIQKAEFQQRDFLGNDTWIKWKQELDLCMSFRKTFKGKPTEEQMYMIEENAWTIKYLRRLLFGPMF